MKLQLSKKEQQATWIARLRIKQVDIAAKAGVNQPDVSAYFKADASKHTERQDRIGESIDVLIKERAN